MTTRKTSLKLLGAVFTVSFFVAFAISTTKAHASVVGWVANQLFPADDMFNWTNSMLSGIGSNAYQPLIGCTYKELSNAKSDAEQKVNNTRCATGDLFSGLGTKSVSYNDNQYLPPSILGMATTLAVEGPQRVDAYPVNLALYFDSLKKDSLIYPKSAYAAGWNDVVLNSTVLGLWKAMRNLAYLIFVLILVVFGFMVMFRYKINPQTVITVQSALPKVIVCLLLITFSWPIGSLGLQLIGSLTKIAAGIWPLQGNTIQAIVTAVIGSVVDLLALFTPAAPIALTKIIVGLVMIVAFILGFISIVITVFTRLARIILMTAFAPLQFALGALPGKDDLITGWFKALLANVLAIPAIFFMFVLGINIALFLPVTQFNSGGDVFAKLIMTYLGQFFGMIIGLWFMWNARRAPKYIEEVLQVGGGWVPGQKPKAAGKK
jgi:hypothetical protein